MLAPLAMLLHNTLGVTLQISKGRAEKLYSCFHGILFWMLNRKYDKMADTYSVKNPENKVIEIVSR